MPRTPGKQRQHFEFALWAAALGRLPTIHEVEGYFQVCRQSAWRIHRNWMRALEHHRIHPAAGKRPSTVRKTPDETPSH